jgi:uncharacterized Tic20 family protein
MTDPTPPNDPYGWQPYEPTAPVGIVGGRLYAVSSDERTLGMLSHLLGIFSFLGPLVIYLMKAKESSFVRDQAAESLNFQITLVLAYIVSGALILVLVGLLLLPAVVIVHLVYGVIAATKANQGVAYRYPINLRLVT